MTQATSYNWAWQPLPLHRVFPASEFWTDSRHLASLTRDRDPRGPQLAARALPLIDRHGAWWILILALGLHHGVALGGRLFVWLLSATTLIPLFKAVVRTWGRYSISVNGNRASVFVGVGKLGWVRSFDWTALKRVRLKEQRTPRRGRTHLIVLQADIEVEFGGDMAEDQRRYFAAAIIQNSRQSAANA